MAFFDQGSGDKDLQYDDAAFIYFFASIIVVALIALLALIIKDLKHARVKESGRLSKLGIFDRQIAATQSQKRKSLKSLRFIGKIVVLAILCGLLIQIKAYIDSNQNQLRGFNPSQILGVSEGASLREIKKAYRALALEFHPDKNVGDPKAQAKFILISKAYECFTDEEKKANCFKFGNPDGANTAKVGIGLPNFFISRDYEMYVLPIVLTIFLVIIPYLMIDWNNRLRARDRYGITVASYQELLQIITPEFNASYVFYLIASLTDLYEGNNNKKITGPQKQYLQTCGMFLPEQLQSLNEEQLLVMYRLAYYMKGNGEDYDIVKKVEPSLNRLLKFMVPFAQKMSNGVELIPNTELKINYIGATSVLSCIEFFKKLYGRSLGSNQSSHFQMNVDLTQAEEAIVKSNKIDNFRNFLLDDQQISKYLKNFQENRRNNIEAQLRNLPCLDLKTKVTVEEREVQEITTHDFAYIHFMVKKLKPTSNYCALKNYPFLKKQRFIFTLTYEENLIYFEQFEFEAGKQEYNGKFQYRQGVVKDIGFSACVFSDCYQGLDVGCRLNLSTVEPSPQFLNSKIIVNPEDKNFQKIPPTFFESMMDVSQFDPEDQELSQSDEDEEGDSNGKEGDSKKKAGEKQQKTSRKMEEQGK